MATEVLLRHPAASSAAYVQPWRPWLTLYGLRVRTGQQSDAQLSEIQRLLPEEMLLTIFRALPVQAVAVASCACRQWRDLAQHRELWRAACLEVFHREGADEIERECLRMHRGDWRAMYLTKPHLRHDGIYVSRNTYIKQGAIEWRIKNSVHMVCYFRYIRFFPDGRFVYRNSPEPPVRVSRTLKLPGARPPPTDDSIQYGRHHLNGTRLLTKMLYPNAAGTEIRTRLRLRSTVVGANNRLDIQTIYAYDYKTNGLAPVVDVANETEEDLPGGQTYNKRGMAPYVFVPWHAIASTPLNLPVSQMDFYVPG